MPIRYLRIVLSSEAGASALIDEIFEAFERVRERAFTIYDSRAADETASEFDDWLQAEREMFEAPGASLESDGEVSRLLLPVQSSASRPLTIFVEPTSITVLGHRAADGVLCLFRRISLSETIDPRRTRLLSKRGTGIQVVMTHQRVPAPEPARMRTMAAVA